MGFVCRRSGNSFKLSQRSKGKEKHVPQVSWTALGFSKQMTYEEACARVRALNAADHLGHQKVAAIGRRVQEDKLVNSVYVPALDEETFREWLETNHIKGRSYRKQYWSYWRAARKLILELRLEPKNFAHNQRAILSYLEGKKFSVSYSKKVVILLNMWGQHWASRRGIPYERISNLSQVALAEIDEAYQESKTFRGESEPLTPEMLESIRGKIKPEQYQWHFCTVWLGLRPDELAYRFNKRHHYEVYQDKEAGVPALKIYQPKLRRHGDKAWKYIPLFLPEMRTAADYLASENIFPALNKTLLKLFGKRVTGYGGRKGFTDLMLGLGEDFINISSWLGHMNINMTWSKYKNKRRLAFSGKKVG